MATSVGDPYTVILAKTWNMLEANSGLTDLVRVSNRLKFDTDDPIPPHVSTMDKPEVRVVPVSIGPDEGGPTLQRGSSSSALQVMVMEIQIATGQKHLVDASIPGKENALRLVWEVARSFWAWQTHYASLTWGDPAKAFAVTRVRGSLATLGVLVEELNRGVDGWSALLGLEVAMIFAVSVHQP